MATHHYNATINWTGNLGDGTLTYTSYARNFELILAHKQPILCSSDPYFRGDPSRLNPEEMLLAAISSCHMLWYLHLCADAGIVVEKYRDRAEATMVEGQDAGRFTNVVLRPELTISNVELNSLALSLHEKAHRNCFISNSVNFPIHIEPKINRK